MKLFKMRYPAGSASVWTEGVIFGGPGKVCSMSFTVYGEHPGSGDHSKFARETAAGAVFKAADLISDGWTSVHISDEKNKIYWPDRFYQIYPVSSPNA